MRFGIVFELSVPRPWTAGAEKAVYDNCLEQARLADELGFEIAWAVEHHFLEEYSHCSSPEVLLSAIAAQTSRLRLGHGIVVCVPEVNHPIRIAERIAALDVISGGRVDVGTGRSASWMELGAFGANPESTKKSWDEYIRAFPQMWTQERFSWDGQTFSCPPRSVLPKPIQQPHPPLWVAVTSPGTELEAASRGCGSLGLTFGGFAEQEKRIKNYRSRIQQCDPVGKVVINQVNTTNFLYCHEDRKIGMTTGRKIAGMFNYLAAQIVMARDAFPSRSYPTGGLLSALREAAKHAKPSEPGLPAMPEGMALGDPERITAELKRWETVGVDRVNFLLNMYEVLTQEEVLASLRLFAAEVMPKFERNERSAVVTAEAAVV